MGLEEAVMAMALEREKNDTPKDVAIAATETAGEARRMAENEDYVRTEEPATEEFVPPSKPKNRPGANTGVKSVIADYAEARDRSRLKYEKEIRMNLQKARQGAILCKPTEASLVAEKEAVEEEDLNTDEEDEVSRMMAELEEDKEFLDAFRVQRLEEIKSMAESDHVSTFGVLRNVRKEELVMEIEGAGPSVNVVVFLYERHVGSCKRLRATLKEICIRCPRVKFLSILASEAIPGYDEIALPTLMVYREGQLKATMVRVQDEIGGDYGDRFYEKDVMLLLANHGVSECAQRGKRE